MASVQALSLREQFKAFQSTARLDLLIPDLPEKELPERLEEGLATDLSHISARRNLFFDEQASLIVVLKSSLTEELLKTLLPKLEIKLSAHATDAVPQGSGNAASASGKHDLTSSIVPGSDVLTTIPAEKSTFAIWKPTLHLPRPRIRLQRPAVYFTAYLNLSIEALSAETRREAQFLTPYEPLPANVLAPIHFDPATTHQNDYISADLLTKGAAATVDLHDGLRPVRGASKRAFPIIPALFTRIKYSAVPDAVLASLHVETSRLVSGTTVVQALDVEIPTAQVENLKCLSLPTSTKGGDELIDLYRLAPKNESDGSACPVHVNITARICHDRRADIDIKLKWETLVDLAKTKLNTSYRWSRPLSSGAQQPQRPTSKDTSRPSMAGSDQRSTANETGIIFNFTAPHVVIAKDTFRIHVQCINDTRRVRRFALVSVQPRRSRKDSQPQPSDSSNASLVSTLFNAPPPHPAEAPDVIDLNPDVRVGPLPPDTSYETEMEFRAMTLGVLDMGAIRIVDLDSRRTVDVRDLPDVVAVEGCRDQSTTPETGPDQDE